MKLSMRKAVFFLFVLCTLCLGLALVTGAAGNEASVNGTEYATLTEALNAAGNGDTVTLLGDVTLPAKVTVSKSITIDGKNHTITAGSIAAADYLFNIAKDSGSDICLKDVTVTHAEAHILRVEAGNSVTLESGTHLIGQQGDIVVYIVKTSTVTMKNGSSVELTGAEGKNARAVVNYGVLNCYGKISSSGNYNGEVTAITNYGGSSDANTATNIYEGAEIVSANSGKTLTSTYAIWSFCPVNVYGGTVTGTTGALYLRSDAKYKTYSNATVTGGTLSSLAAGSESRGVIQIEGADITVTIKGNAILHSNGTAGNRAGIWVIGTGATINISENATVEGRYGLFINASGTETSPTTLNMTGGNLYSCVGGGSVLQVQKGNTTDKDGTVTTYDIYVNLNISGGNFGPNPTVEGSNNGKINVNGINFGGSNSTVANINISGGEFTSVNVIYCNAAGKEIHTKLSGNAVLRDGGRESSNDAVFKITGAKTVFTLEMTGGRIDAGNCGIYVTGNESNVNITVDGGQIITVNSCIYVDSDAAELDLTISDVVMHNSAANKSAIHVVKAKTANITVTGGNFYSTKFCVWVQRGCGATAKVRVENGMFVAMDSCLRVSGVASVTDITGGSFYTLGDGEKAGDSAVEVSCDEGYNNCVMNIYGGFFYAGRSVVVRAWYDGILNVYGGAFVFELLEGIKPGADRNVIRAGAGNSNGTANVYGGYFESNNASGALVYAMYAGCTVTVSGGVFAGGLCPLDSSKSTIALSTAGIAYPEGASRMALHCAEAVPGASVRLLEGSSGLRFTSEISAETLASLRGIADKGVLSFGTLIIPTDMAQQLPVFTLDALRDAGYDYLDIVAKDGLRETENGLTVRAAIVNILPKNIGRAFSAVCYIKYTVNGETVYAYADYQESDSSRCVRDVAKAALEDVSAEKTGKYCYPYGDVFSPYSEAQRNILLGYYAPAAKLLTKTGAASAPAALDSSFRCSLSTRALPGGKAGRTAA